MIKETNTQVYMIWNKKVQDIFDFIVMMILGENQFAKFFFRLENKRRGFTKQTKNNGNYI